LGIDTRFSFDGLGLVLFDGSMEITAITSRGQTTKEIATWHASATAHERAIVGDREKLRVERRRLSASVPANMDLRFGMGNRLGCRVGIQGLQETHDA
jgi:hypothetical protein